MTNVEFRMTNEVATVSHRPDQNYDLEERTAVFGETIIKFLRTIRRNAINTPIISQLVRSSTSIGANYCEADNAESRKDFRHKIGLCRKESRESNVLVTADLRSRTGPHRGSKNPLERSKGAEPYLLCNHP